MKPVPAPWITHACTRRTFLQTVAAGLAAAGVFGCQQPDSSGAATDAGGQPAWLANIIGEQNAAAQFGRIYLEAHPAENSRDVLVGLIEQATGATHPADPAAMAMALQQVVRAEYARDAVVAVDGWVLGVTEARLYALVSVLSA
jgi:hypothetical protein